MAKEQENKTAAVKWCSLRWPDGVLPWRQAGRLYCTETIQHDVGWKSLTASYVFHEATAVANLLGDFNTARNW